MTHIEICGPDTLEVIYLRVVGSAMEEEHVVRWCRKCGAVVVDVDVDGRTHPGRVSPMRFPESMGKKPNGS